MPTRRQFLGALGFPAVAAGAELRPETVARCLRELAGVRGSPQEIARDEDFWFEVARAFSVDRSLINFNNGGVSPAPKFVMDAHKQHLDFSNKAPTYTMWRVLQPEKEIVRARLARQLQCDAEEVAITRNASEGLQACQFGFDLERGDEVLCTNQDYPRMRNTFAQRAAREGIVLRTFAIPTPCEDPARIVELYREHITERTRLILVCHVINLTGQILPVRQVVALGRAKGIPVIVDGAHAFANVDFTLPDLDCDYYASSLHKWLFAPIGTGLLYVRREKIPGLWPLMAGNPGQEANIRKFEEIGTHPVGPLVAIGEALTFHQGIGPARKVARLLFLRDRWARRLAANNRVRLHTSLEPGFACGIATVQLDGIESRKLAEHLFDKHRIVTAPIVHDEFEGIRVSPSVYSTLDEVDRFSEALEQVLENGLPS